MSITICQRIYPIHNYQINVFKIMNSLMMNALSGSAVTIVSFFFVPAAGNALVSTIQCTIIIIIDGSHKRKLILFAVLIIRNWHFCGYDVSMLGNAAYSNRTIEISALLRGHIWLISFQNLSNWPPLSSESKSEDWSCVRESLHFAQQK